MPSSAAPVDVSGRPLALRDVDLDAFLHPKTVVQKGVKAEEAKQLIDIFFKGLRDV